MSTRVPSHRNTSLVTASPTASPTIWYAASDVRAESLRRAPFEHLAVPIPRNAERILRRLYGEDCLTRYVACRHLGWSHALMTSFIHSNLAPIRLARIAARSLTVTQPKRAFKPIDRVGSTATLNENKKKVK